MKNCFKTEEEGLKKIKEFDYNPSKEKQGPVIGDRIINKTCCAIYRCQKFFMDKDYLTCALLFIQSWINDQEGNDYEATIQHFNNSYVAILKDFEIEHVNILMARMALQKLFVDGEGLDTQQ